jgi:hypothetical protein
MMGIPTFFCPEHLRMLWSKPIEVAGFHVEFLPDERQGCPPGEIAFGVAHVLSRTGKVSVTFHLRGAPDRLSHSDHNYRVTHLGFSLSKSSKHLAQFVERTFLASGSKSIGKVFSCQRLYQCPAELLLEWPGRLCGAGFSVELSSSMFMNSTERRPGSPSFLQGYTRLTSYRVSVFTGPAINSELDKSFFYIGLDCQSSVFSNQSARQNRTIIQVDQLLQTWGAHPIEPLVVPFPRNDKGIA